MHVVTVNPTTPVGEQDVKPTPTGRIVVDFLKRKFPAYVETGLNLVDVRVCARGMLRRLEKGKTGRALHSGRRESDAQTDSRHAGEDHRAAFAEDQVAVFLRVCDRGGRRSYYRTTVGARAARHG